MTILDVVLVLVVALLVLVAYSLGLSAGHRMSRWKEPIPGPKEVVEAITPEPKGDGSPDKPESEDDEAEKMWQMFAAAAEKPEPPKGKD
jgi:hypothetical protein